mmetsp:Transcript_2090/g.4348  ORF Transcript_2090/g.4348 Transcript_2090/m.4348 type:complete len:205 (-) Transcript_2090:77-691(-)
MKHEHMAAWKPEEDQVILSLYAKEGRKWGRIAAALPGRTSASVRNRYLRIEKGTQLREAGLSKNRCAACGQQKIGHVCPVKLSIVYNEQFLARYNSQSSYVEHIMPGSPPGHEYPTIQFANPMGGYKYHDYCAAPSMAADCGQSFYVTTEHAMMPTVTAHAIPVQALAPMQPPILCPPKPKTAFHFPLKKRTSVPGLCRVASAG